MRRYQKTVKKAYTTRHDIKKLVFNAALCGWSENQLRVYCSSFYGCSIDNLTAEGVRILLKDLAEFKITYEEEERVRKEKEEKERKEYEKLESMRLERKRAEKREAVAKRKSKINRRKKFQKYLRMGKFEDKEVIFLDVTW